NNTATGGTGGANDGQGLGGAIFAMQSTTNVNGNNQGMPTTLPTVTTAGNVVFSGNTAGDANGNTGPNGGGAEQDNNDIFGTIVAANSPVFTFEQFAQFQAIDNGQLAASNSPFLDVEIGNLQLAELFDETEYLAENADVAAAVNGGAFATGFDHFVRFGINEGRSPSAYFDEAFYLAQNADVAAAVENGNVSSGLAHYLNFGHLENRDPSALFDASDYLLNNPDVAAAVDSGALASGFEHFIEFGDDEGRLSTLLFEEAFYLQQNADVAAAVQAGAFDSGFEHFISFGQKENRDPSNFFDEATYLDSNADVAAAVQAGAFSSGFEHFALFGRTEGRVAV
ncbi:MAG: hypothetical protein AAF773_06315, partial [Cyanobacteria bacterium P01_D01_bin.115]